ncbi:MAG: hypothetical protein D6748_08805 [Calditrichaeota bacterium]|nr:MAG: hypothetical protein D6748_08805 [Calditrichota bacterium]
MKSLFISTTVFILFFCLFGMAQERATPYSQENQLDLNNATFEEIARLPIPKEIAEKIYDRIEYGGPLSSVYQLREIEGITPDILLTLKPLVRIEPFVEKSEREERIEELYFRLDRWEGQEGTNQALIDSWIERALEPVNINDIRYDELLNLQGVSPVDAAAIVNFRHLVGNYVSLRDLRTTPNLSYFGYRNTRNFITFERRTPHREFHGHILFRMTDTPFLTEEEDVTSTSTQEIIEAAELAQEEVNNYPDIYTRFIGSWGKDIKLGFSYWHSLQEPFFYQELGALKIPKGKFYLGLENQKLGPIQLRKLYIGNYSLAFAHGVVMENTDFFTPRKSGLGFRKRFLGISGDNSRTREFKLSGVAAEFAYKKAHLFLFGSFANRDAILNTTPILFNGKEVHPFNQFIVLDQRFRFAPDDQLRSGNNLSWRNSVKELLLGFRTVYDLFPTTQIGLTYYESAYNRPIRPEVSEIVAGDNLGQLTLPDNEIFNSYGGPISDGKSPFWKDAKSFRRVYGLDFSSVYQNVWFQAEYAELDKGEGFSLGGMKNGNPWAFVGSVYVQYDNFYLMGLYRNYQLGFDNPYQRSFSNYRRFKRTIYEDYFYLQSPYYGQLFTNNPQPQPERGFYFNTRYQLNRKLVASLEYDNWRRNSDDVTQYRLRGTLEYRPIFPLRISLRQKYQAREKLNEVTTEFFENLEFRGMLRARLSRFNELGLLYMNSVTTFRPRPRLYYPIQPGIAYDNTNLAGNVAAPGEALGGFYTHNFNEWLKVRGFLGFYKGFFWTFEDTQFFVVNSDQGAMRYWISLYSRISNHITMRLKYTRDRQYPRTFFHSRDTNNEPIVPGNPSFRQGKYYQGNYIQDLQEFFYVELNYNF